MDQQQLRQVYEMVDGISFSRAKKNINRDFSDGVMMAQLIHHYRPKAVELHSYPAASSAIKKINNWNTLNTKVLKRLGIGLGKGQIQDIVNCVPLAIQSYLYTVMNKFESPAEQVNVRQQIKKVNTQIKPNQNTISKSDRNNTINPTTNQPKQAVRQIKNAMMLGNQTDQVFKLIQQIQDAYGQLLKLQEMSKLKDQVIKNLEKKVEKMIFS